MKKLLIIPIVFSSLYVIMFPIKTYKHDYYIFDGGHAIDAAASSATATNKRWAVMMIGGARTYACTRQSFLWNVVNQTNPPMDIIVSTVQNSCSVDKLSSVLLEMDSKALRYHDILEPILDNRAQTLDRFQQEQGKLLQLIDNYAKEKNITYDFILYTRPDLHYTRPMNIAKLETTFEENGNGTIFTPKCCAFGGWCDRLAVASYKDFARMIKASDQWVARGVNGIYEVAFMDRGLFVNLTRFDMHITPNLTDDYGFVTARLAAALVQCNEKTAANWWHSDMTGCNNNSAFSLNPTPAMCKFLNLSLAVEGGMKGCKEG